MGKYYTMKHRLRRDRGYEVHGDVITPPYGDCFTDYSIEGAIKALRKIAKEKGIEKKLHFEKSSDIKRKAFIKGIRRKM